MTEQTWCAEGYDKNARFVSDLGMPVVELLNAKPGERILDLGCGDGVLNAGFTVAYIEIIPRPTPLPGDISGFLETFAGSFTSVLPSGDRQAYIDDVRDPLKPLLCGADGAWTADYTRLRFEAYKNAVASHQRQRPTLTGTR